MNPQKQPSKIRKSAVFQFLSLLAQSGNWLDLVDLDWSWDPSKGKRCKSIRATNNALTAVGLLLLKLKKIEKYCFWSSSSNKDFAHFILVIEGKWASIRQQVGRHKEKRKSGAFNLKQSNDGAAEYPPAQWKKWQTLIYLNFNSMH